MKKLNLKSKKKIANRQQKENLNEKEQLEKLKKDLLKPKEETTLNSMDESSESD